MSVPSGRALEQGLEALVWDGVFSQALGALTGGPLLAGCALALGASPAFIGILAAIPFFAQLAHIPAVILIERLRRRQLVCLVATGLARLLFLPLALLPMIGDDGTARLLLLLCFALIAPLGAIGGCAWMSWVSDLVPCQRLGGVFARRQLRANISGILAGLAGGAVVDRWASIVPDWSAGGYVGVFSLAILAAAASTWCLARMPDVPMPAPRPLRLGRLFLQPFATPNFRRLMVFLGGWSLAVNLALPFFTVYVVQDLNAPISTAIALGITSQLANAATLPLWGRLSDRCSNKTVLGICGPVALAAMVLWVLAAQPAPHALTFPILIVAQLVMGAATGGLDLAGGNIALKLAPKSEATVFLAANALIKSLCAGLTPIAGGLLAGPLAGVSLTVVLPWRVSGEGGPALLHLHSWQLFFIAAAALGAVALSRLARVEEGGTHGLAALLALVTPRRRQPLPERFHTLLPAPEEAAPARAQL
jgi:MFS family permease